MSTLSRDKIIQYMKRPLPERLVVTPIFNLDKQLSDGALDVRLGNQFIVIQRTSFLGIDPSEKKELKSRIGQYQAKINVNFQESFVLHPNQLVLGSTLEYIALPNDLTAYVIGRSSWGRLGLVIATATFVNPGFKGCLTLEMENLGEVPLTLYPGLRIAQLIFHTLKGRGEYGEDRTYQYPTGPEFSKIYGDKELEFWAKE